MERPWLSLTEGAKAASLALARLQAELSALGVRPVDSAKRATAECLVENPAPLSRLFRALDSFPTLVGYLQGRRSEPLLVVNNEAAVQDLLYISLKTVVPDLVYEEPTAKGAAGFSIGDFSLASLKLILEVKYIKTASDVKVKANEIAQDIWQYSNQTDCQTIIFFVYDPHMVISDRPNFISSSAGEIVSNGRPVTLYTLVKPE